MPSRRPAKAKAKASKAGSSAQCQLLKLSSEVQLAIVKHVDALGLLRLEQTCKHFFQLVNDPKAGIWRQRLRSHSTTHNLFWPSFKDLTTVQDFKGAATASLKFAKFSAGMSDSTPLSKFKSDVQLSRDIEEGPMHLIPGGRYVVMLEAEQVSVVDLHAKDGEDSIVATYETERPLTVAEGCVWVAENGMKVYILQQFTSPIKQRINSRDPCKSTTTTYTLLEFGLGENRKVSVEDKATLRVAHWAESLHAHPVMGSSIALTDDEMGVTVIWNPVDNEVAALRVGCLGSEAPDNIGKVFSHGSFMFFANGKGIQAVEIPCFDSLDDDTIIMSDLRPNTVECYTAKLSRALASVQERNILIPASPGLPVLYDFLVKDTEADSLHVHRHALEFNPDLPDKITLKLVEISKCSLIRGSSELTSQHKAFCDGRVAYLWVPQEPGSWASPNQAYVSLSPPIPSHVNNVVNSKFSVTPCYEKEAEDIYEFGLCPISGIGIGLKGSAIEVYNILRGCRA